MEHYQQERRLAAQAFQESLDQLSICFRAVEAAPQSQDSQPQDRSAAPAAWDQLVDLQALEDAIQDIEQLQQD